MGDVDREQIAREIEAHAEYCKTFTPSEMFMVGLSAAAEVVRVGGCCPVPPTARAVVDAVETEDETLCRCGHDKASHEYEYSPVKGHCSHGGTNGVPECRCAKYRPVAPAPSPAGDDAERAIAGLLAEHRWSKTTLIKGTYCTCGWNVEGATTEDREAHVASVIAAHMAAPDELTAQTDAQRLSEIRLGQIGALRAERDALRERVRALADEWEAFPNHDSLHLCARDLRAALGDA